MATEFTKEEAAFLLSRIDEPVTIRPSQMPQYYQMATTCAGKLQPQQATAPPVDPPKVGQPTTAAPATADDLAAAMVKVQKPQEGK